MMSCRTRGKKKILIFPCYFVDHDDYGFNGTHNCSRGWILHNYT